MSMDLDDILGNGKKYPKNFKFVNVGDECTIQIEDDPKPMPVREFIKGKPGEQQFWQGNKVVLQSDLNMQLPFNPVAQVVVWGKAKDGSEYSLWLEGEKLKAVKAAIRETGERLAKGGMIRLVFAEEKDTGAPFPKKLYTAQLKSPKEL